MEVLVEVSPGVFVPKPAKGNIGRALQIQPIPGTQKQMRGRFLKLDGAGGIKFGEWPDGADITEMVCFAKPAAGEVLNDQVYVLVTTDSANSALESSFLTQVESLQSDVQWWPVPIGVIVKLPFSKALVKGSLGGGKISAKTVGGVAVDLWLGGS